MESQTYGRVGHSKEWSTKLAESDMGKGSEISSKLLSLSSAHVKKMLTVSTLPWFSFYPLWPSRAPGPGIQLSLNSSSWGSPPHSMCPKANLVISPPNLSPSDGELRHHPVISSPNLRHTSSWLHSSHLLTSCRWLTSVDSTFLKPLMSFPPLQLQSYWSPSCYHVCPKIGPSRTISSHASFGAKIIFGETW